MRAPHSSARDAGARKAYDNVLKARKAAEIRNRQLDEKRRKLKDSLEALQAQQFDGTDCCVGADQVVGQDDQLAEPHISANVANGSFNGQKFNG